MKKEQSTENQVINILEGDKMPYFPSDNQPEALEVSDKFVCNSPENWYRSKITVEFQDYGTTWIRQEDESNRGKFESKIMSIRNEDLKKLVTILIEKI